MKASWIRASALAALVGLASSSIGCGYILHPERRGNSNAGPIDGLTLLEDLLWLIPGILPGVVFLIVDFSAGTMYVNGRIAMNVHDGHLKVALEDQPRAATLDLRVVSARTHRVLGDRVIAVGPDRHGQTIDLAVDAAGGAEPSYLLVLDATRPGHLLQQPIALH